MKEKEVKKTIYIADNGKEFLDKKSCEEYEKIWSKICFFDVDYNFDYTEGRGYEAIAHIAVIPSEYDRACDIAEKYAIDVLSGGKFAGQGCQGWGLQKKYEIRTSTKEKFEENRGVGWGCHSSKGNQIFISEKALDGFPKPYNYKKEWGIK